MTTWIGPTSGNWSQSADWFGLPGGFSWPSNSGGTPFDVFVEGSTSTNPAVFLNVNPAVANLTIHAGDALSIANGTQLQVGAGAATGALHNDGVIKLGSSGTSSILWCGSGNTTIDGAGEIVLSGAPNSRLATWSLVSEPCISGFEEPEQARLEGYWSEEMQRMVISLALARLRAETHIAEPTIRAFELSALRGVPVPAVAEECGMSCDEVYVARNRVLNRLRGIVAEVEAAMEE